MLQRAIVLLSLIMSLGLPVMVQAQSPTPTQDTGFISQFNVTVALPEGVLFYVTLRINRELLAEGTLTITQPGDFRDMLAIDPARDVIGETLDTTDLRVVLPLTGDLQPFEVLDYQWDVTTTEGQTATAIGQAVFAPANTGLWEQAGEDNLRLRWSGENFGGTVMFELLQPVYQLLAEQTGRTLEIDLALLEPEVAFCQTTPEGAEVVAVAPEFPCSEAAIEAYFADNGITLVRRGDQQTFEELQNRLTQNLVEDFYQGGELPQWFLAGLAPFYRPFGGAYELLLVQQAAARDALPALTDAPAEADQLLWTAQAYTFLLYLADTYGAETPFALASARDFEAALQDLTGASLPEMYRAFQQWVVSGAAERAVYWNPYLATTPTATPTRTATALPPTRTPTSTPTETVTPTSTSIIGQERTPVVNTPTSSPTQPVLNPTNTPLPPGSLPPVAPTSTPAPAANSEEGGGGLPCGAAAAAIPAIVIGITQRKKRRRG